MTHARLPSGETPAASPPSPVPPAGLIDFTVERQRHRRFLGRDGVLAQLDQWLLGPGEAGWVVVTGGPGMGKSAILSAWLARREAAGAVVAHHFVRRQVASWDQPEVIAASLAAQIEAMFPELRDPAAKPEERLIELLGRVSKRLGPAGDLVVLVDGLDETRAAPGDNPLPRFLPHSAPDGIRLLCAMRPTYPHLSWIEARSPARRIDLDDRRWAASNEAVVRGFWEAASTEYEPPLPAETIAATIDRADGNVLYAVMLHDALRGLPAAERRVDRIPRGLKGLIGEIWDRAASHKSVRVGLGLLCAAQEALSLDVVADLAGWGPDDYEERERFVREARQLLLEEPASWAGALAYRPRHDWVRELMAERLGGASIRAHHATLARKLATWPAAVDATARRYALRHALVHRVEAGEWVDAWRLAADVSFLEAKCRELGAHEAEADVARAAECCPASGDEALRGRFDDLVRTLGRESHWLRTAPEAVAALVWNRLRLSGWSAGDLDQQLRVAAEASFLRVRHVATRESPALMRDLVGHSSYVLGCAVTADGRRVVSASADGTLKVWDLATGRALATLEGHTARVTGCAVTPDGQRVVSASSDHTLKVWDLATGRALATLEGHASWVLGCAVTPDGQRVVSASEDRTLKVWDLATGRALATLEGHTAWVSGCAVTPDGQRVVSASSDRTLKVWDLTTGRALATLEGHAARVRGCAVTPDGQRVVSASEDKTLKVWDLASRACLLTHRANASFLAVTATATIIIAGDVAGAVWFLDLPSLNRREPSPPGSHDPDSQGSSSPHNESPSPRPLRKKHTILFLAANPTETAQLALDREARTIQRELESAGFGDRFELVTRWAVEPLDLLRELRRLRPTVVHFSGHGGPRVLGEQRPGTAPAPRRDIVGDFDVLGGDQRHGLFFQGAGGRAQFVSAHAIEETFGAAGSSVKLVVLNACYSDVQADALLAHIDCVVGMSGSIRDDAARSFAIGFYGGLGERESVAAAYKQGRAALSLEGLPDGDRPQLKVRAGVDATRLVLAQAADPH